MAVNQSDPTLKALEEKCQLLENQCSDYVRALERTNQRLEKEIRKQKRTESRLKISEMRFRKIFEHAPFGAAIADREGSIVLANHALCRMLGYSQHELQRMHFADITHKEDVDSDMERFRQLIDGAIDHYNLEKRYHTKQNKVIWGKHGGHADTWQKFPGAVYPRHGGGYFRTQTCRAENYPVQE
ncbi:PAS domain S-box protein [Desulfosarcina variabilis]|uniref:PAS domain S-box protein n=1 Tax=Desulfosarcina variabilis TaxID=2300 RepID=UPI003AFA2ECC